jgi:hypothetical protein
VTPITEQIRCAKRELALRQRVYPGWVRKERMKLSDAQREIAAMQAIVTTLEHVRALIEAEPARPEPSTPTEVTGVH